MDTLGNQKPAYNTYLQMMDTVCLQTTVNQKEDDNSIKLYPNPTTDFFTIQGKSIQSFSITNISGQVIFSSDDLKSSDEYQVNLSKQPKGIYFVKIKNDDFFIVKKIVIQ